MGGLPVKPKLQGYVQQELFDEFERFRATHSLNQSKALEKLLAEYFGKPSTSTLPHEEAIAVAALRSELVELKLELTQRLQVLEDRLADSSAHSSATLLDGLADESAAPMISLSDESVTGLFRLVAESASNSVDIQSVSDYESAISLDESAIESAVVEDAITVPMNVSAVSSADESAGESVVAASEPPEEEPATSEPEEAAVEEVAIAGEPEKVSSLPVAAGEPLKPLTSLGLGKRLKKNNSSISRNKDKGNDYFREWSAKLDPDGIAWEFRKGDSRSAQFHPLV